MLLRLNVRAPAGLLALLACIAQSAEGYVGPGAGGGGSAGVGWGGIVVIVIAGGLALGLLCGLVAIAFSVGDRLKRRLMLRRSDQPQAGIDGR